MKFGPGRSRALIGALAVAGALAAAPAAHADPLTYEWSGADSSTSTTWSDGGNWIGGQAPSGTAGITFPSFCAGSACESTLDGNITAQPLTLADDQNLLLDGLGGDVLTLAPDSSGNALSASPGSSSGAGGQVAVNVPIALTGDESWSVTGATFGSNRSTGLNVNGTITGTGDALTVALVNAGNLNLDDTTSVGSLVINGANTSQQPVDNGSVSFEGQVNAAGGPITVDDALISLEQGTTGPLTLLADNLVLQSSQHSITNGALTLDASDTTAMILSTNPNDVAETASGNVTVGGSLIVNPPTSTYPSTLCPTLTPGTSQTLIQSTHGTLTGQFTDLSGQPIPDGGVVDGTIDCSPTSGAPATPRQIAMRVNYTGSAVTVTYLVSSTTSLALSAKTITTNQPETLSASVTQTSGTPNGTMAFSASSPAGVTPLPGCAAVAVGADGTATCHTNALAADPGRYYLAASYTPSDAGVGGSTNLQATLVKVNPGPTATALYVDHPSSTTGATVTYTASVAPSDVGPAAPTGQVSFNENGTPVTCLQSARGAVAVSGAGVATCTLNYNTAATHTVTATYLGDENFAGSVSPAAGVTVSAAPATTPPVTTPAARHRCEHGRQAGGQAGQQQGHHSDQLRRGWCDLHRDGQADRRREPPRTRRASRSRRPSASAPRR